MIKRIAGVFALAGLLLAGLGACSGGDSGAPPPSPVVPNDDESEVPGTRQGSSSSTSLCQQCRNAYRDAGIADAEPFCKAACG